MTACRECGEQCQWVQEADGKWRMYDMEGLIHSHGTCKECGAKGMWYNVNGQWSLRNDNGNAHACCKKCGEECEWAYDENDRMRLFDLDGDLHEC